MSDFYETLFGRRDVRSEFQSTPIPADVVARLLIAAHHAPSVGLSQPWNFILVDSAEVKSQVFDAFLAANEEAASMFALEKRDQYRQLKLQGILDAPLNICVTCDRERGGDVVLGKTHQPEMDTYSTVCAVQNLWLAARAEKVGMGWVSIIEPARLSAILHLPERVVPIAYLCLGYVTHFRARPELEERGWEKRKPVDEMVFTNQWQVRESDNPVYAALHDEREWLAKKLQLNIDRALED